MALASTIFIVDPCIDIWGWSEGQGEQFGTHLGRLGPSGRYGYFWLHIWTGCGSEPVRRRCPETPPKVRAIHGATSGSPNSELIKALKKVCPPPLNKKISLVNLVKKMTKTTPSLTKWRCYASQNDSLFLPHRTLHKVSRVVISTQ